MTVVGGWNGVVTAAAVATLLALALQAASLRRPGTGLGAWSMRMTWAATGLATLALLWLVSRFLAGDVAYEYVFSYTATNIPWEYRLAGTWTGREGSLLLWTVYIAAIAAVMGWKWRRAPSDDPAVGAARAWTQTILLAFLSAFMVAIAWQELFRPTDPFLLQGRPDGAGLNPTLLNPYILIHPPMMFLAYALTTPLAASGLAHLITGTDRWHITMTRLARGNWVLYSVAMGLGGLWAYYTLGFGGYWAWDPVEVANFLPWLALTVYLHAALRHRSGGGAATAGPLLAVLPFLFTIFSTVSTRSGLWVSVHAFTDPTLKFEPDAARRLLDILGTDASLIPYASIMVGTLALALGLWCRRLALDEGVLLRTSRVIAAVFGGVAVYAALDPQSLLSAWFALGDKATGGRAGLGALAILVIAGLAAALPALVRDDPEQSARRWSIPWFLGVSTLLLALALVVATMFHLAAVNGWDRGFWEARVPWLATPIAAALMILLLRVQRGHATALRLTGATLLAAVLAFLLSGSLGLGAYAMTWSVALTVAGADKMQTVSFSGPGRVRAASLLLWLGALLDLVFWINPPQVLGWTPAWPWQIPMTALALLALWGAHRIGAGRGGRWPYVLVAVLGGFFVAPLLAVAAYIWHRRAAPPADRNPRLRLRPVAVYGVHFVVGLLFIGYSASTYFDDDVRTELAAGEDVLVGGGGVRFDGHGAELEPGTPWVERLLPQFTVHGRSLDGILYWEPQTGAHYPLPATARFWDRDLYVSVDSVCISSSGEEGCQWLDAYASSGRVLQGDTVDAVQVQVLSLPGVSLVWASLALFGAYGALLAWLPEPVKRSGGQDMGKSP